MAPIEVLVVDDHPVVLLGLGAILLRQLNCRCSGAATVQECLSAIEARSFAIAIVDAALGKEDGLGLIRPLREAGVRVLVYSMFEDPATIRRALDEGAQGYVSKRDDPADLLEGLRGLIADQNYLSPAIRQAFSALSDGATDACENLLSKRELQAVELLGKGWSRQEIAESLQISVRTLDTYLLRSIEKLELPSMQALRKLAVDRLFQRWSASFPGERDHV